MKIRRRIILLVITAIMIFSTIASVSGHYTDNYVNVSAVADEYNSADELLAACNAKSIILTETNTNAVLGEKNAHEKMSISHLTKLMTILLVSDELDKGTISFDTVAVTSAHANSMQGTQIWLNAGEKITVDELLTSITVGNANDAAVVLAELVSGSEENFVVMMNEKAKNLGMSDTTYIDCSGISSGNVSTAYDLSVLSSELVKKSDLTDYFTTWLTTVRCQSTELVNMNKLVRTINNVSGLKACNSSESGECLITTQNKGELSLCIVVLGAESEDIKFSISKTVSEYTFTHFEIYTPEIPEECLSSIAVNNGQELTLYVELSGCDKKIIKRGTYREISVNFERSANVTAPVNKGDVMGNIVFTNAGGILLKCDIVASSDIQKSDYKFSFLKLLYNLFYI